MNREKEREGTRERDIIIIMERLLLFWGGRAVGGEGEAGWIGKGA